MHMKLYIIDDDELIHTLYGLYLNELVTGYEVESFYNGFDAIKHIQDHASEGWTAPDIILLDVNMPIMDGIEFLTHFDRITDQINKQPTIFIVSSCLMDDDYLKNLKHVTGVFSKPISKNTLKDMIFNQLLI